MCCTPQWKVRSVVQVWRRLTGHVRTETSPRKGEEHPFVSRQHCSEGEAGSSHTGSCFVSSWKTERCTEDSMVVAASCGEAWGVGSFEDRGRYCRTGQQNLTASHPAASLPALLYPSLPHPGAPWEPDPGACTGGRCGACPHEASSRPLDSEKWVQSDSLAAKRVRTESHENAEAGLDPAWRFLQDGAPRS